MIADEDIACAVPYTPCSVINGYDWFLSSIRFGRMSSIIYSSLFTVSARLQSHESYAKAIEHANHLLEDWRLSIPEQFRPRDCLPHMGRISGSVARGIAVHTHYLHVSMVVVLERLAMQVERDHNQKKSHAYNLLLAARSIIEATRHIEITPQTSTL